MVDVELPPTTATAAEHVPPADHFTVWLRPHLPALRAIARREVGDAGCDDVVQETALRAWQRRDTFDPSRGSARAWLVAILLDRARRHRIRQPWIDRLGDRELSDVGNDVELPSMPARFDLLEAAVTRLPRRQRQLVTLVYVGDMTATEAGVALGISASTAGNHLRRARATLKAALNATDDGGVRDGA